MSAQVSAISCKYLARFSPTGISSGCFTSRFPMSSTVWPSFLMATCRPAPRKADGPMSTPRRLWPRSMGTPMMRTFCGICISIRFEVASDEWRVASAKKRAFAECQSTRQAVLVLKTAEKRELRWSNYPGLRIHAVNHAREGDDFANVFGAANPGDGAFEAKPEAGVRHAAVTPQIEIPLK